MARIVELKQYDNVLLGRGVMQNWVDLDVDGPSWRPLVADLVPQARGRVLVVGPMELGLLERIADEAEKLTVVVRAAQDAGTIATLLPGTEIFAGDLPQVIAAGESYDTVLMVDDFSRVLSAEAPDRTWHEMAMTLLNIAAPGATVMMALENERGLHRASGQIDTYAANFDRDWTPFRTWDATRPRTLAQLQRWIKGTGRQASAWGLYPSWVRVDALTQVTSTSPALRDAAAAYALRGYASPLPVRSAALADVMDEVAAGWIVAFDVPSQPVLRTASEHGEVRVWDASGEALRDADGTERRLPPAGRTMLMELIEMAADSDTPSMRAILKQWYAALLAVAEDGQVPASHADARLRNVYLDGEDVVFLEPAAAPAPLEDVVWRALSDYLSTLQIHGLKHPWPTAMNRMTRLASLGAMAGAPRSDDLAKWVTTVRDEGQTREELLAVVKRQQDELKSVWARWKWDEKDYAAFVAKSNVKKTVRYAKRHGKALPKVASKRIVTTGKKTVKKGLSR